MSPSHRVCIIGGGPQGLTALKNLLELNDQDSGGESLFHVDLLESRHSIGGIWTFTKGSSEITALRNTVQNTSRFRNCYSDFPVADAWEFGGRDDFPPAYLTQEQSAFYLELYARKFDLRKHIKFGRRVVDLRRDDAKEQWQIEVLNTETAERETHWYDKVIVATGQHHDPMLPRITGMEHFRGQSLHAAEFKGGEPFRNQTVLLVGSSNSAGDVATEVATAAASVIISRR